MPTSRSLATLFTVMATAPVALAADEAANSMTEHLGTLWTALYVLGGLLLALIVWEVLDRPRAVRLDAGFSQPQEPDNDYIDPTKIKFSEPARPATPPSFSPPPPPAPEPRAAAPSEGASRVASPPPPPPPAAAADDDNPFRRLSKLGNEDSPLAAPRSTAPPLPVSAPPVSAAPPADSGGSSGGWADLLQRVRAGEPSSEDSGKMAARPVTPPSTEDDASSSSSAAWESLLKKSAHDISPAPDQSTVSAGELPRAIKLGIGLGGGEEEKASPVDPLRMALDNPSTDPEENLPDFVKKATRTIALDLKKGGEQTPPPPMPKTEG